MGGCSVLGCNKRTERKDDGISFHSFPPQSRELNKWVKATGRQNWVPPKHAKICSIHFDAESFITKEKFTFLKAYAVPTKHIRGNTQQTSETSGLQKNGGLLEKPSARVEDIKIKAEPIINDENNPWLAQKTSLVENMNKESMESQNKNNVSEKTSTKTEAFKIEPIINDKNNLSLAQKTSLDKSHSHITEAQDALREVKVIPPVAKISQLEIAHKKICLKLQKQKRIAATRLLKLRAIRASQRRLKQKVVKLENVITELKSKMTSSGEARILYYVQPENMGFTSSDSVRLLSMT